MQTFQDGSGTRCCALSASGPGCRDRHAGSHEIQPPAEVINPRMLLCAIPCTHMTMQDYQLVNTSAAAGDSHSLEYAAPSPSVVGLGALC